MKYSIYILLVISIFSCGKNDKEEIEEDLKTIPIAVINPYWDSMYVTTNLTHTQLSVKKKGIAGKPKSTNEQSITINAADKDSITFQTLLKFANKFERHPLFLKEFAYTIGYRAP